MKFTDTVWLNKFDGSESSAAKRTHSVATGREEKVISFSKIKILHQADFEEAAK